LVSVWTDPVEAPSATVLRAPEQAGTAETERAAAHPGLARVYVPIGDRLAT
jgi:hypothetical protein